MTTFLMTASCLLISTKCSTQRKKIRASGRFIQRFNIARFRRSSPMCSTHLCQLGMRARFFQLLQESQAISTSIVAAIQGILQRRMLQCVRVSSDRQHVISCICQTSREARARARASGRTGAKLSDASSLSAAPLSIYARQVANSSCSTCAELF